ncbi:unnamed protein product [Arabidopsis halleri]
MSLNGPKFKSKINRPSRGLIYGPIGKEIELSESGKRLRVETGAVGRPRGRFVNDDELQILDSSIIQLVENVDKSKTFRKRVHKKGRQLCRQFRRKWLNRGWHNGVPRWFNFFIEKI